MAARSTPPTRRRCAARRPCVRFAQRIRKQLRRRAARRAAIRAGIFTARVTRGERPSGYPAPASRAKQPRRRSWRNHQRSRRQPVAAKALPASAREPVRFQPPALNKNSIVLQVAAVKVQRDALEMADAIQQKRFPFVCRYIVRGQSLSRTDRPLPRYGRRGKRQALSRTTGL